MYRVIYKDKSVNTSGLIAECKTWEEAERIYKEVEYKWKDVYIEKGEETAWEKIF